MDMTFCDDECRVRTDHASANFTTTKHMALNLIRRPPERTPSAPETRSPPGMTTSSQASSPGSFHHPIPRCAPTDFPVPDATPRQLCWSLLSRNEAVAPVGLACDLRP